VGERPADPLTVEAFVTTEARFALRGDAGRTDLTCRRDGARLVFQASDAPASFVLRVHEAEPPGGVTADGRALSRMDAATPGRADTGWTVDGRVVVVKARAREIVLR
jgi:hypothetical protein